MMDMITNSAIMIIGRISSGKSTLAKQVVGKNTNTINISFGTFLKNYCLENGIDIEDNRHVLQNLGQKFIDENPEKFLNDVVNYFSSVDEELHIFEGVRHISVFEEIQKKYANHYSIYLEVPSDIRYKWYSSRKKEIDSKLSYEGFLKKDTHKVELEIESLKDKCGLTVNPHMDVNYIQKIYSYLKL